MHCNVFVPLEKILILRVFGKWLCVDVSKRICIITLQVANLPCKPSTKILFSCQSALKNFTRVITSQLPGASSAKLHWHFLQNRTQRHTNPQQAYAHLSYWWAMQLIGLNVLDTKFTKSKNVSKCFTWMSMVSKQHIFLSFYIFRISLLLHTHMAMFMLKVPHHSLVWTCLHCLLWCFDGPGYIAGVRIIYSSTE